MSDNDIAARVKKIVVDHLGIEEEKVTENASFIDDLGADSLDTVELVMAFEEEFGCEIPDDAAEKILTVKGRNRPHRADHLTGRPERPMARTRPARDLDSRRAVDAHR